MQGIDKYRRLYKAIGYTFTNEALLEQALTHRSAAKQHNERLEFLGDAILGMIVGETLFKRFPTVPEGKLTRMRSTKETRWQNLQRKPVWVNYLT